MDKMLYQSQWLKLSNAERLLFRSTFAIPRSSGTIMEDNKLKSDGCTEQDLRRINVESMQNFLSSKETDFDVLFAESLNKIQGMVAEQEAAKEEALTEDLRKEKLENAINLCESILETIKGLPIEAQQHLKEKLNLILVDLTTPPKKSKKHVEA